MADHEIQEVRRIRHAVSASHGHDLERLLEYYRKLEAEERRSGKHRFEDEVQPGDTRTRPRADHEMAEGVPTP